jgi:hypothetical protein
MSNVDNLDAQRVLQQFEHEIVDANRRHISEITGEIGKGDILKIGESISICRANYLKAVLDMAKTNDGNLASRLTDEVKSQRLLYEETMQGFAALRHALERGYVVIKDD